MGARLVVMNGAARGAIVPLNGRLTIGRRPENDLALADEQVSRFHATIGQDSHGFYVEDLASRAGVWVGGHRVQGRQPLTPGSHLLLGQTEILFELAPEEPTTPDVKAWSEDTEIPDAPTPEPNTGPFSLTLPLSPIDVTDDLERQDRGELLRKSRHLRALLFANDLLSTELDLDRLFERILDTIFEVFPAHRAAVLIASGTQLELKASRSRQTSGAERPISRGITDRAFRDRVGLLLWDAGEDERFEKRQSIVALDIRSALCAPLLQRDECLGVLYLDTLGVRNAFREDDLSLLNGIASAAAGAVKNAMLVRKLRDTAVDTIFRLAVAAEYRDGDTGFHLQRMSDYAETLAEAMGLNRAQVELVKLASPMHDVGKIAIPDAILKKPGRLTDEEFTIMKEHTTKGGAILANASSELLQMAENIALTHHERFDGQGYPRRLAGTAIPLEGRIVAVADVFDALTSRRCYKPAFGVDKALDVLRQGAGTHFDPDIVRAFFGRLDRVMTIRKHYLELEQDTPSAEWPSVMLGHVRSGPPPGP